MPTKNKALTEVTMESIANGSSTDVPIVQCAVNRRVNLGGYEHIDLLGSLKVPVGCDMEEWHDKITVSISEVFKVVSKEVNDRYQMIKDAQGNSRPSGTN